MRGRHCRLRIVDQMGANVKGRNFPIFRNLTALIVSDWSLYEMKHCLITQSQHEGSPICHCLLVTQRLFSLDCFENLICITENGACHSEGEQLKFSFDSKRWDNFGFCKSWVWQCNCNLSRPWSGSKSLQNVEMWTTFKCHSWEFDSQAGLQNLAFKPLYEIWKVFNCFDSVN